MKLTTHQSRILLFKHLLENTPHFVAILIITLVFRHFINEEERQALDAPFEQLTFFLEVRHDSFTNLYPLHVQLVGITDNFPSTNGRTIQESHITIDMDFRNSESIVFRQARLFTQTVPHSECLYLPDNASRCSLGFYLNSCHRWLFGRQDYIVQIQITACSS